MKQYIQLGQLYLQEGRMDEAHRCFEKALEKAHKEYHEVPVKLVSLYGLTLVLALNRRREGLELCKYAVTVLPKAEYYWHLGRAFIACRHKPKAIRALKQGLKMDRWHVGIRIELKRLGRRRRPPLILLSRQHFLNRYLGMALRKPHAGR